MQVVTSSLSLARELWRYGEPALAEAALRLSPEDVADVGLRIGDLALSGEANRLWPDGPKDRAVLLAAVERLEGAPRPCARTRRLPEKSLPPDLQASEAQRWAAAEAVALVVTERHLQRPRS
jgi:hypothetical protein